MININEAIPYILKVVEEVLGELYFSYRVYFSMGAIIFLIISLILFRAERILRLKLLFFALFSLSLVIYFLTRLYIFSLGLFGFYLLFPLVYTSVLNAYFDERFWDGCWEIEEVEITVVIKDSYYWRGDFYGYYF